MKSNFCYRFTILDSNNTREKKENSQFSWNDDIE
jgi:hypothetical protein